MESNRRFDSAIPCLLILLQDAIFGFADSIAKAAYATMPVYSLLSIRYLLALLVLLCIAGRRIVCSLKTLRIRSYIFPCFFMTFADVVDNTGLMLTTATSVAFLRSLSVIITPLLAAVILRKRLSPKNIFILFPCVLGLYFLCLDGKLFSFGLGELCGLSAAFFLALSLILGKKALAQIDPITFTAVQTAASAIVTTLGAFAFNGGWHAELITPSINGVIVYLALICTLVGYWLQNAGLRRLSPSTVALLQCLCPVMTAVFSHLLLQERLSPVGAVGAALLLLCVLVETIFEKDN